MGGPASGGLPEWRCGDGGGGNKASGQRHGGSYQSVMPLVGGGPPAAAKRAGSGTAALARASRRWLAAAASEALAASGLDAATACCRVTVLAAGWSQLAAFACRRLQLLPLAARASLPPPGSSSGEQRQGEQQQGEQQEQGREDFVGMAARRMYGVLDCRLSVEAKAISGNHFTVSLVC